MKLCDDNFVTFGMATYDNVQCHSVQEFEEDLRRFSYVRRLFDRYTKNSDLKEKLIVNHLITIFNLFGDGAVKMLFFKIDREYWSILVTFLIYLNRMPEELPEYNIKTSDIKLDQNVYQALRNI